MSENSMDRRGFLEAIIGTVAIVVPIREASRAEKDAASEKIAGVAVLRYPPDFCRDAQGASDYEKARGLIRNFLESIRPGSVIALPNTRDEYGEFKWDLKILPADGKLLDALADIQRTDGTVPQV